MSQIADKSRRPLASRGQTFHRGARGDRGASERWLRRVLLLVFSILVPTGLLITAALGLVYVKLLNGPIALTFLNDAIASSISSQLPGMKVKIDAILLALRGNTVELRLKNISLRDQDGKSVAASPLAAIELHESRIFYGEFSPASIVLIKPEIRVHYGADGEVSFSLARTKIDSANVTARSPARVTGASKVREQQVEVEDEKGQSALLAAAAQFLHQMRVAPVSGLTRVGFREGSLIVQHAGGQTTLQVPTAEVDLDHDRSAPALSGRVSFAGRRGLATMAFKTEMVARSDNLEIKAELENLWPETFAGLLPKLSSLSALRVPLSGAAKIVLDREGEFVESDAVVEVGGGQLTFPGWKGPQPTIESARVHIEFGQSGDSFAVSSATLRWAKSEIVLSGAVTPATRGRGNTDLDFEFEVEGGKLWTGLAYANVRGGKATGSLDWAEGVLHLRKAWAKTEESGLEFSADVHMGERQGLVARGRLVPSPVHEALGFWPTFVNPDARSWVVNNVAAGATREFDFSMRWLFPAMQKQGSGPTEFAMALKGELLQAEIRPERRLPPILAPELEIEIKDHEFSARLPTAEMVVSSQQKLNVVDLRFDVEDIYRTEMDGAASFRIDGQLAAGLAVARELDADLRALIDKHRHAVGGRISGQFNVVVPLYRQGELPPPTASGQLKVSGGYGNDIWQGYSLSDAEVRIDLNPDGAVANGKMRVAGIPARLNFQRFYGIPKHEQPPLRIRATLRTKDRARLGLQTRHSVNGPVDLDVVFPMSSGEAAQPDARIRVDLGKADIEVESLAWRKPAGKPAAVDIDLYAAPDESAELRNVNLAGDGVAVRGSAKIDHKGKLLTFDVQDLSIDVVTNLQLKGERREGDVWRVSARGATFEGRQFFSSLFSTGRPGARETEKDEPGLDLDVRIGTVLGYWDSRLSEFKLDLSKRNGKIVALHASGKLGRGRTVTAVVRRGEKRRRLVATSNDAGALFKLVGFYPSLVRGGLEAVVNLDGRSAGEKSGRIYVRKFGLLGDEFISEVLQTPKGRSDWSRRGDNRTLRHVVEFDWMQVPFHVGRGQFVMRDVELRGPVLGVLLCGRADFNSRRLQLAGTYVPLQGLSSIFGAIPGVGELLTGPKGAGIVGINFEIKGAMQRPEVLVNPLSAITPGIFREVFQIACPKSQYVNESNRSGKRERRTRPADDWATRTLRRQ